MRQYDFVGPAGINAMVDAEFRQIARCRGYNISQNLLRPSQVLPIILFVSPFGRRSKETIFEEVTIQIPRHHLDSAVSACHKCGQELCWIVDSIDDISLVAPDKIPEVPTCSVVCIVVNAIVGTP
jgi:hypothetical protein